MKRSKRAGDDALLRGSELAKLTGLSPRQIAALANEPGCPARTVGTALRFDGPRFVRWYANRKFEQGRQSVRPADFEDARARKMIAEAELSELELAVKRNELMTIEDGLKVIRAVYEGTANWMNSVPGRHAQDVVGLGTPALGEAALRKMMLTVRTALREGEHLIKRWERIGFASADLQPAEVDEDDDAAP